MIVTRRYFKDKPYQGYDPRAALDPEMFFRDSYQKARASATGVGKLVFEFIPMSVIRSLALTIDPLAKFRGVPVKITPVNRTRYREVTSVLESRHWKLKRYRQTWSSTTWNNYLGLPGGGFFCYTPPLFLPEYSGVIVYSEGDFSIKKQPANMSIVKDTTSRSRPPDSGFGEFESFRYSIHSPPQKKHFINSSRGTLAMECNNQISWSDDYYFSEDTGPGGVLSAASINSLRTNGLTELSTVMQRDVLQMLSRVVPESRRYTAFRNVVELKDLPRSILATKRTLEHFNKQVSILSPSDRRNLQKYLHTSSKVVPSEYVNFHFGWKQLYKDITDLLEAPERVTREINRLIRRSGQPTTFRTKRKIPGSTTGSPSFEDYTSYFSQAITMETVHSREHELRLVVNATFDFPKVGVPQFQKDLYLQKLGIRPMFTDLYNLTPWSWLYDWFTGLGNYVEAIDIINTDRSLFNWGLLTGITHGKVTTTRRWYDIDRRGGETNHVGFSVDTNRPGTHESVCHYILQMRKNITTAYDVKTILEPSSLSLYQQSILGAILASRRRP